MNDLLVKFLIAMDKDEKLKQQYVSDPKGTAKAFGLSDADVQICAKNDIDAIKSRCEAEGADNLEISHSK
tara:strand:+ start:384 stop:593 length:210 start_codon:yes stop_codon:yes gene_type:complete